MLKSFLQYLTQKLVPSIVAVALIITCTLTVLLVGASVFMRYILKSDLFGVEELITLVTLWLYFLGAIYGSFEESHIHGDLLNLVLKTEKQKKVQQICVYLYCVVVLSIWSKWAFAYTARCFRSTQVTPGWRIPLWTSRLAISVGIWGMFAYSIFHLVRILSRKTRNYDV